MKKNRITTFPPVGTETKGVIQFIHGMCEHKERYIETMKYFSHNGYICIISDLPGHGENLSRSGTFGYFGTESIDRMLNCVHRNTLYIKKHYPDLKYILFGHSMGSLVCRAYLKTHSDDVDTAIICSSPSDNRFKYIGKFAMKCLVSIFGGHTKSNFAKNLCTGTFERRFRYENLENSWICSDKDVVHSYNNDELCGFTFTLNGYDTLVNLLISVYSASGWQINNPDLPVYFISGEYDPCMGNKKRFHHSVNILRNVGFNNIHTKIFPEMRHEILNEKDKKTVYDYVLTCI